MRTPGGEGGIGGYPQRPLGYGGKGGAGGLGGYDDFPSPHLGEDGKRGGAPAQGRDGVVGRDGIEGNTGAEGFNAPRRIHRCRAH